MGHLKSRMGLYHHVLAHPIPDNCNSKSTYLNIFIHMMYSDLFSVYLA